MPLRQPDNQPDRSGRIIAAFPATGKSYLSKQAVGFIDSDSSRFSRLNCWPVNYVAHVRRLVDEGATVLVSTHAEVRQALVDTGLPLTLVYPDEGCRHEYRGRMLDRGSPAALIEKVMENWYRWLTDCRRTPGRHIVLRPGEYLSDVLAEVRHAA